MDQIVGGFESLATQSDDYWDMQEMLQDAREKTICRDHSCRCICFILCSLETLELVVCALSQRGRGKEIHCFHSFIM